EFATRAAGVKCCRPEVTGAPGPAARLDVDVLNRAQHAEEGVDRGADAGADAVAAPIAPGGGQEVRARDIFDIDVITHLLAIPMDRGRLAQEQLAPEDGHDPGLAVRVLAGAVDVAIAEAGERQIAIPGVVLQV